MYEHLHVYRYIHINTYLLYVYTGSCAYLHNHLKRCACICLCASELGRVLAMAPVAIMGPSSRPQPKRRHQASSVCICLKGL